MRYRLRTLLIGAALGPPLLALVWFAAIWARYALPQVMRDFWQPIAWVCMTGAVGLALYSVAAPPPGSQPAASLSLWHLSLLGGVTFLALWQWLWVLFGLAGWMFLWGDNGPPYSERTMLLFPGAIALLCTIAMSIRIRAGLATVNYVFLLWCLATPLALIAALFWISHWLR
jgi:hypothetical protein